MLTAAQLDAYRRDGFVVLPAAAPASLRAPMLDLMLDLRHGRRSATYYTPPTTPGEPPVFNPHRHDRVAWNLATHPPLVAALTQVLGDKPMICQSMFFFASSLTRPHQDEFYMAPSPRPLVGMWIALQHVTPDDGPIAVIPGSQRGPFIAAAELDGQWWKDRAVWTAYFDKVARFADTSKLVSVTVQAGDVILFDGRVIHAGQPPRTPDRPRHSFVSHHHRADAILDDHNNGEPVVSQPMN